MANSLSITGAPGRHGYDEKHRQRRGRDTWVKGRGYVGNQGRRAVSAAVSSKVKEKWRRDSIAFLPKRIQSFAGRGLLMSKKLAEASL